MLLLARSCEVLNESSLVDLPTLELLGDHLRVLLTLALLFAESLNNFLLGHDARHTCLLSFELLVLVLELLILCEFCIIGLKQLFYLLLFS